MRKIKLLAVLFIWLISAVIPLRMVYAQEDSQIMQTFFESESQWPGLSFQVNATKTALPEENVTVILKIECKAVSVYLDFFNISVFGFIQGENKTLLESKLLSQRSLENNDVELLPFNVTLSSDVWYVLYGEISFRYSIGGFSYSISPPLGFTMTTVKNVYLENLEENFTELQQNYTDLMSKYNELSNSVAELENTRYVVIILAITTVFFVATTLYLVFRKPKEYW